MSGAARRFLRLAAIFGMTAVMLGAFAAHGLKSKLDPAQLANFDTGVRYQMFHAIALLAVAILLDRAAEKSPDRIPPRPLIAAGGIFTAGIIFFSGSLYLLTTRGLLGIENWKWLGPITPLGGVCFITGWLCLFVSTFTRPR